MTESYRRFKSAVNACDCSLSLFERPVVIVGSDRGVQKVGQASTTLIVRRAKSLKAQVKSGKSFCSKSYHKFGNFSYATNILCSVFPTEGQIAVEAMPNVISIQQGRHMSFTGKCVF